ncbi:MAG: hypothetical protein ABEJ35_07270 [Halobacteriaceae archaeon]
MLGSDDARRVTCIACGRELDRGEAREYDKEGDRWERRGKSFEYVCKPCFKELSKADRDGLEARLVDLGAGDLDRETFLRAYLEAQEADDRGE